MRVLVIGAGSIGRRHLANLAGLGVTNLQITDPDRARAEAVAAEHGATTAPSLEEALVLPSTECPEVAIIASPTHLHVRQALACVRAGLHVFIEKPLGATLADLEGPAAAGVAAIAEAARRSGRFAMVGCNLRFDDVYAAVRTLLDEGTLGRVHSARLHFGYDLAKWRPGVDYRSVYSAHRNQGGGVLLDAIHEIDLALSWFGLPSRAFASSRRTGALEGDVEDTADLQIEHRSGVVSQIHLDYLEPVYRRFAQVSGDRAIVEADFAARTVTLRTAGEPPVIRTFPDDRNEMYVRELRHFLDVCRGTARPIAILDDGIRAFDLALAARDRGPVCAFPAPPAPLKATVVVQARMGSSRLPGKVLMEAAGKTLLAHLVERLKRSRRVDRVIIATTSTPADRAIVDEAARIGVTSFVGDEQDVLSRYVACARAFDLSTIVRVTGDCPLLDATTVDHAIARFGETGCDYLSNALPRSVPDGFDVEIVSREALERADREALDKPDREHVTRWFYTHPERFAVASVAPLDRALACRRWTLDTRADYDFIRSVFDRLYPTRPDFRLVDILALLEAEPHLDTVPRYAL